MPDKRTVQGRIIRIVDLSTVLVNLGRADGILPDTVFRILSESEEIIDPVTEEVLGNILVVKARLKSRQVYDRFTIASSRWTTKTSSLNLFPDLVQSFSSAYQEQTTSHGNDLNVDPTEIEEWAAYTERPVRVGDTVEAEITVEDEEDEPPSESS